MSTFIVWEKLMSGHKGERETDLPRVWMTLPSGLLRRREAMLEKGELRNFKSD